MRNVNSLRLVPAWEEKPAAFRHAWSWLGNIDQFRWLSRADVLEHLRMARDELGVRYVRAAAMYSPEMKVWDYPLIQWRQPTGGKSRQANWQLIDITIENLLALGLKPIYTTCFTPVGMTDQPGSCWPDQNPIGMPRDLGQWGVFVASGIRHHVARFGLEEVRSWYFECWNEPNLSGFFGGTKEEFFRLWSATWHAVKSVDPALRFGGPSTARGEWVLDFLDFAEKDGTPPDYLVSHVYNNDSENQPLSPFDAAAAGRVVDPPHFARDVMQGLRADLDRRGWEGEFHWNEWGRSWFPYDPRREGGLDAAFIVKTMAEVSQEATAFALWCISDIYDQAGFQASEFEANYGMLSLHGLRKPSWFAHVLLNRLGESRVIVSGGNDLFGAIATRGKNRAELLVYAYPASAGADPEPVVVRTFWPFGQPILTRLDARENNIIAAWREMGAPAYPTSTDLAQLRRQNTLVAASSDELRLERGTDGTEAVFEMECPGVALLEVIIP